MGFSGGPADKESGCNARDLGSITGLVRSHGEEKVYPLQYSGLENSGHGLYSLWDLKEWIELRGFHFHKQQLWQILGSIY